MNRYQDGIRVVAMPMQKVSKYAIAIKAIHELEPEKAIQINRAIFGVGDTPRKMKHFIKNLGWHYKKKFGTEVDGFSKNGSIFMYKKPVTTE